MAVLIDRLGFFPVDMDTLASGAQLTQLPGGALAVLNLVQFG